MRRDGCVEYGIDDTPRFLDYVLAREQNVFPAEGIPQQPVVGLHLVGMAMARNQFHILADHLFTGQLVSRPQTGLDRGREAETQVIGRTLEVFAKHGSWRAV